MKYVKALQARKPVTKIPSGMTREKAAEGVKHISAQLKGPMSDTERVLLVHDRADLRDILALFDGVPWGNFSEGTS
jgi:hypothetical protein